VVLQSQVRPSVRIDGPPYRTRVLGLLQPGAGAVQALHPNREGGRDVRQARGMPQLLVFVRSSRSAALLPFQRLYVMDLLPFKVKLPLTVSGLSGGSVFVALCIWECMLADSFMSLCIQEGSV
jgi:hypothetical protein